MPIHGTPEILSVHPEFQRSTLLPGNCESTTSVSSKKNRASTTLPGRVEKVIRPHPQTGEPEKAQIAVEGADHLYRELRVPNTLENENGEKVKLKEGAEVDVKIEADTLVTSTGDGGKAQRPL
jgi:hypothetical protein